MPDKYSVVCRAPSNSLLSLLSTILHLLGAAAVWDYCKYPNVTENISLKKNQEQLEFFRLNK